MSVLIRDYLNSHDNGLTRLLSDEKLDGVFLDTLRMDVRQREWDLWCDIYVAYTLSRRDFEKIADGFDGFWWCISPCPHDGGFRLSIQLKVGLIL